MKKHKETNYEKKYIAKTLKDLKLTAAHLGALIESLAEFINNKSEKKPKPLDK
jgi:hypothetical protein